MANINRNAVFLNSITNGIGCGKFSRKVNTLFKFHAGADVGSLGRCRHMALNKSVTAGTLISILKYVSKGITRVVL